MSSMSTALQLLSIAEDYSLYAISIIFIMGLFGNLINILVFTALKLFRSNQCVFYLITESSVNIGELFVIFLSRYLVFIYGNDPVITSIVWCKLRTFLGQTFRLLSTSMVCFAAFDQFLSTNPRLNFRQLSTFTLAKRLTIISICIWILHGIPFILYFHIDTSSSCRISNIGLRYYYSFFYYPILHGFLAIFITSLFSVLAYQNVRHLVRRQVSIVRRRLDRQLTAMIFVRVIFFIILLLPYSIHRIYLLNVSINSKQNFFHYAVNQLIEITVVSIMYLNYAMNFYIFMISSSRYRRQVRYVFVKKCWKLLKRLCHIHQNEIHPMGGLSVSSRSELE